MKEHTKLYLLFSHQLSQEQELDAKERFGVEQITPLPEELLEIWSNIPAEAETVQPFLEPIRKYIEQISEGDYVLVQGDFGATYIVVEWVYAKGAIPIYATTKRNVIERKEGSQTVKTSIFKHVRYRVYGE